MGSDKIEALEARMAAMKAERERLLAEVMFIFLALSASPLLILEGVRSGSGPKS